MTTDAVRGVPWRDPLRHHSVETTAGIVHMHHHEPRPPETSGQRIGGLLGAAEFGAESSSDWFECRTDEPDTTALYGLGRGVRWSDVVADIQADALSTSDPLPVDTAAASSPGYPSWRRKRTSQ